MEGQRLCSATADDGLLERSSTHLHDNYQPDFHIASDLKSLSEWPRFTICLLGFMNGFTSMLDRDVTVKTVGYMQRYPFFAFLKHTIKTFIKEFLQD